MANDKAHGLDSLPKVDDAFLDDFASATVCRPRSSRRPPSAPSSTASRSLFCERLTTGNGVLARRGGKTGATRLENAWFLLALVSHVSHHKYHNRINLTHFRHASARRCLCATVVVETLFCRSGLIAFLSHKKGLKADFTPSFFGCKEQAGTGYFVRERQPRECGAPHPP